MKKGDLSGFIFNFFLKSILNTVSVVFWFKVAVFTSWRPESAVEKQPL